VQSTTSTTDQNNSQATTPDQSNSNTVQPNASGANAPANSQLPQTASPLPLMGLMGMGSLLTGLFVRRKKN
jgi:LPXTG-motif cell wall-anchored protein